MKAIFNLLFALFIAVVISSCENNEKDIEVVDYSPLLSEYAQNTVVKTYLEMVDNAFELYTAVDAYTISESQTDFDNACAAWKATRAPWERSEAFLFGPAANHSLDPQLDSWPLDQAQLQQVLDGTQDLSAQFVRDGLGAVLRGFHTIEYLLFRDGQNRNAADLSLREKEYLLAVTEVLRDDCIHLWALWAGVTPGTAEAYILEQHDIEVLLPFATEFAQAGKAGSRYTTQRDAVEEMLQGIIDIADEVANAKLADPYTTKDVLAVESWYSWNSLTDFTNNIISIRNAYTSGNAQGEGTHSLSALVAGHDATLDAKMRSAIDKALAALAAIPTPYRSNLNANAEIQAAMSAINEIADIVGTEIKPLILN